MKQMEDLRDMLCDELKNITEQGDITQGSLDIIDKLTHSIKSIDTIMAMEEANYSNNRGYSRYDGYSRRGSYDSYDDSYRRRNSYARGRGNSRDSQGRYSNGMMDEE